MFADYPFERTYFGAPAPRRMRVSRDGGRDEINIHVLRPAITPECCYDRINRHSTSSPAIAITCPTRNSDSKNSPISILFLLSGVQETSQRKPLSNI